MIETELAITIITIAGISNLVFIILVFLSCRCMAGPKISNWLFKYSWFKKLYAWHCYIWWGFFLSVIIHTTLAFYVFGLNSL